MGTRIVLAIVLILGILAGGAAVGYLTRDRWLGLLPGRPAEQAAAEAQGHGTKEQVILSPQARANLRLEVKPIQLEDFARSIPIPGMVIERQGRSDRTVTTPIAGVVRSIAAVPGEAVRPGDPLFTVRLTGESIQNSQAELFKTTRELEINEEQRKRLMPLATAGSVSEGRLLELEYQQRRHSASVQALRYDLAARGLASEQIQAAAAGRFVTEIVVRVPSPEARGDLRVAQPSAPLIAAEQQALYEVEELKIQPGDQVQAGQVLCTLANHLALYVEGRVFREETALLERAAENGWPVRAEFMEEAGHKWQPLAEPLKIQFLGNRVETASQTVPVYAPLANQYREHNEGGKTYRVWRFRPGQRVRLYVPVERFTNVIVLPIGAVVRDGPDAFVFRANGDAFVRKSVHVAYEDRQNAVLANDGSINAGNYVAFNGAAQLNRVLKAAAAGGEGSGHEGHGHDH